MDSQVLERHEGAAECYVGGEAGKALRLHDKTCISLHGSVEVGAFANAKGERFCCCPLPSVP